MDNEKTKRKIVRVSRTCDEISAKHFFKLRETGDLQWMCPKYDGWKDIKDRLPENVQEYADDIAEEYSKLTKNNTTLQYMEYIDDIETASTRIYGAAVMLDMIKLRWKSMSEEARKKYVELLGNWNFILNPSKPLDKELARLHRQLRAAKTKLKRMEKEKEAMEKNLKNDGVDIIEFKVTIQNILKTHIDLAKISIKEFHYIIKSASNKKAA